MDIPAILKNNLTDRTGNDPSTWLRLVVYGVLLAKNDNGFEGCVDGLKIFDFYMGHR